MLNWTAAKGGAVSLDGNPILNNFQMTYLPDLHQDSSSQPPLPDSSDVPGFNLYLNDSPSVSRYLRLALQTHL